MSEPAVGTRRTRGESDDGTTGGRAAKRHAASKDAVAADDASAAEAEEAAPQEGDLKEEPEEEEEEGEKPSPPTAQRRTLRPRAPAAAKPRTSSARTGKSGGAGGEGKSHTLTYHEGEPLRDLTKYLASDTSVLVRIPPDGLSAANKQVRNRQLWGTDVYTDDSDLVAVLQHTGFYVPAAGSQLQQHVQELRARLRPLPPQDHGYISASRNGIRSRAWGSARSGCSYKVESCCLVTTSGSTVNLDPALTRSPAAAPTFVPAAQERIVNTRSAALNLERRQRFIQEVTMQYNLCNEPWVKYSASAVADRGLKRTQWTSARMKKEALYVETHARRYELACEHDFGGGAGEKGEDTFVFSACKEPLPLSKVHAVGVPLPKEHIKETLAKGLLWEDIKWGPNAVLVSGKEYPIVRLQFLPRAPPA